MVRLLTLEQDTASTLEFARTYYPYVRFGLALILMNVAILLMNSAIPGTQ